MRENNLVSNAIINISELQYKEKRLGKIDKSEYAVFLSRLIYIACMEVNNLYQINPFNHINNTFMGYKVYFIDTDDMNEIYLGKRHKEKK